MVVLLLLVLLAAPAHAGGPAPFEARAGVDLAAAAAQVWAPDAFLVYVENDEALDAAGAAERWGYLFFSPSLDKSRGYSVRGGKIVAAEYLEMKLEAPPVALRWIDSGAALKAAEQDIGRAFRRERAGRLSTMLLMRGAFDEKDPDETTWMLVYSMPSGPSLFVVVDATEGRVRKMWRG